MTRLMGAVLLALGCGAVGWGAVGRLERRVRDLRELAAGLDVLQRELGWRPPHWIRRRRRPTAAPHASLSSARRERED